MIPNVGEILSPDQVGPAALTKTASLGFGLLRGVVEPHITVQGRADPTGRYAIDPRIECPEEEHTIEPRIVLRHDLEHLVFGQELLHRGSYLYPCSYTMHMAAPVNRVFSTWPG